ncbi:MAG: hypothetical protein U0670_10185 [Anaerolineae bacterium]
MLNDRYRVRLIPENQSRDCTPCYLMFESGTVTTTPDNRLISGAVSPVSSYSMRPFLRRLALIIGLNSTGPAITGNDTYTHWLYLIDPAMATMRQIPLVTTRDSIGAAIFSWSPDGEAVAVAEYFNMDGARFQVLPTDPNAGLPASVMQTGYVETPVTETAWSPNGHWFAAVTVTEAVWGEFIILSSDPRDQPLSYQVGYSGRPVWSEDGTTITVYPHVCSNNGCSAFQFPVVRGDRTLVDSLRAEQVTLTPEQVNTFAFVPLPPTPITPTPAPTIPFNSAGMNLREGGMYDTTATPNGQYLLLWSQSMNGYRILNSIIDRQTGSWVDLDVTYYGDFVWSEDGSQFAIYSPDWQFDCLAYTCRPAVDHAQPGDPAHPAVMVYGLDGTVIGRYPLPETNIEGIDAWSRWEVYDWGATAD